MTTIYVPEEGVEDVTADEQTGRLVRVVWVDSGLVFSGWAHTHELPKGVAKVETVGYWVGENDSVIAIAASQADGSWLNIQLIYKPCIVGEKEWLS